RSNDVYDSPCGSEACKSVPPGRVTDSQSFPSIESTSVNQQTSNAMSCAELAHHIERLQPGAAPQDVARLCLLLTNSDDGLQSLREQRALRDAWKRTGLKLQVATDQHAAMTEELEALAASDPKSFT